VASRLLELYRSYKKYSWPIWIGTHRFIARAARLRMPTKVGVCLDVGAGNTPHREEVSRRFAVEHYVALDFTRSDAVSVIADAHRLPIRDHSVDLVVCFALLHVIAEYRTVLEEMKRVLRPGGDVLISFAFIYGECDVVDFHRWTVAGMEHELKERGFTVLETARRGGILFTLVSIVVWAIQHAVPGARLGWRAPRTLAAYCREGILALLTFPLYVLAWFAIAIDALLPQTGCYTGALIYARAPAKESE
jgi:SAM-dependent methyltransferase